MKLFCVFEQLEPGVVRCSLCERTIHTNDEPHKVHAACKSAAARIRPPKKPCGGCGKKKRCDNCG